MLLRQRIINAYLADRAIYASIGTGIYASVDEGETFRMLRDFQGAAHGLRCVFVARHGNVFVSPSGPALADTEKGLWRSPDEGANWERVLDLSGHENPVAVWGLDEDADGRLFAGVYTLAPQASVPVIYRSCDGGEHWEVSYAGASGRHVHAVVVDQWSGLVYASIGDDFGIWKTRRIIRSSDHGDSWVEILAELPQVAPILVTPSARLFGSDYPGMTRIYRTTDDSHHQLVLSEDETLYFFWMRRDQARGELLASAICADATARQAKIFRSVDDGRSWHLWRVFEASAKGDGSAFASNVSRSRLMLQVQTGGMLQNALILDLKR